MANGISSTTGALAAYADAEALVGIVPMVRTYLPEQARVIFDDFIVLKPASFWSPVYLRQLGQLSHAIFLFSIYQDGESKEIQKARPREEKIEWYVKRANEKLTIIKHLQNLLQLTPTQVNGQSRDVNKGVEQSNQMVEIVNDKGEDLYS